MIGIIVSGHGNFASGLTSGLKLLAGEPEDYEAVDFEAEDSIEDLTGKLKTAVKNLESCEAIVIFTDLTGGSPFNVASRLKMASEHAAVEVTGGTNLPVVLHGYMSRVMFSDAKELADASLKAGKEQMIRFQLDAGDDGDECECEEYED